MADEGLLKSYSILRAAQQVNCLMIKQTLRIATRKSPLALWQANHIAQKIQTHFPHITIKLLPLVTSGDRFLKDKLLAAGGKGLFVKELEEALLDHRADIAVHSMKDVPSELPQNLILQAICHRDDPFDALISPTHQTLETLPENAIIGTASLRRKAQLLAYRADLNIQILRGNINTRLEKLNAGQYDAIILAGAALQRMNWQHLIAQSLMPPMMIPSCGQGALGIECRVDDPVTHALIAPLNDPLTSLCVLTERRVNTALGGNCHVPLAIYCAPNTQQDTLRLQTKVMSTDGQVVITDIQTGAMANANSLADQAVKSLRAQGADQLLSHS